MRKELLEQLYKLRRFGIKPGLERISQILAENGNPHNKLRVIHIAGTNGKGSVASLLASIYKEGGYNVGLYTSPHIFSFNERIRINGQAITDNELEPLVEKYLHYGYKINATFFEITTAVAFEYFANSHTDICVVETGLGGRFDATNIIDPEISVLTKIDFDHEQYLGKSLEEITFEKAGIIKPSKKAIISFNPNVVYEKIEELKRNLAPFMLVKDCIEGKIIDINPVSMSMLFNTEQKTYQVQSPLIGMHQFENIATSIVCVETLLDKFPIDTTAIINGIKNVRKNSGFHGRYELIRIEPPVIIDVGHNPNAIRTTIELTEQLYPKEKWQIIFASMSDKNYPKMLEYLLKVSKRLILPQLQYERAEKNSTIAEVLKSMPKSDNIEIVLFNSSLDALEFALQLSEPLLIIGSFYLLAELVIPLKQFLNWDFEIVSDQISI